MLHICIGFLITLWPLMFVSVYKTPHTRVVASEWIRKNIPITKTLSAEHWDDALPLCLPHLPCAQYTLIEFPLYEPDSTNKWINMYEKLSHTDYIVMSSNRLYGSITWAHKRYPQTNAYYHALFNELLGFKLIQTFTSRPTLTNPMIHACLPIPWSTYGKVSKTSQQCNTNGMSLIDDYGDESFTVYDHPAVSIFKKEKLISQEAFLQLLGDNTTEDSLQK